MNKKDRISMKDLKDKNIEINADEKTVEELKELLVMVDHRYLEFIYDRIRRLEILLGMLLLLQIIILAALVL